MKSLREKQYKSETKADICLRTLSKSRYMEYRQIETSRNLIQIKYKTVVYTKKAAWCVLRGQNVAHKVQNPVWLTVDIKLIRHCYFICEIVYDNFFLIYYKLFIEINYKIWCIFYLIIYFYIKSLFEI